MGVNIRDWIDSVQNRDKCRVFFNAEFNLGFHNTINLMNKFESVLRRNTRAIKWIGTEADNLLCRCVLTAN